MSVSEGELLQARRQRQGGLAVWSAVLLALVFLLEPETSFLRFAAGFGDDVPRLRSIDISIAADTPEGEALRAGIAAILAEQIEAGEIDLAVVDIARKYLGSVHKGRLDDPRLDHHLPHGYVQQRNDPAQLLQALLGTHLAMVSPKAQATRIPTTGVITDDNSQIVLIDLPGLLDPAYLLQQSMRRMALEALTKVDLVLHLHPAADADRDPAARRGDRHVVGGPGRGSP